VSCSDFDSYRQVVDRIQQECQSKAAARDLEGLNEYIRTQLDTVAKELLLRVTVKDVCLLLDQKANLVDVNKTLENV
jgi:hypothetical protein